MLSPSDTLRYVFGLALLWRVWSFFLAQGPRFNFVNWRGGGFEQAAGRCYLSLLSISKLEIKHGLRQAHLVLTLKGAVDKHLNGTSDMLRAFSRTRLPYHSDTG